MSHQRLNRPAWALASLLAAGLVPAQAAEPALKAVDVGNGQRLWVEARPAPANPSAPVADTVWINGQAVRVLREPGAAAPATAAAPAATSAATSAARSTTPARPNVPAGAKAVQMPDGSKMWVLPER